MTTTDRLAEIERRLAAADNGYGAFSSMRPEMDALVAVVKAVREQHVRMDAYENDALIDFCDRCQRPWPCQTIQTIDDTLETR